MTGMSGSRGNHQRNSNFRRCEQRSYHQDQCGHMTPRVGPDGRPNCGRHVPRTVHAQYPLGASPIQGDVVADLRGQATASNPTPSGVPGLWQQRFEEMVEWSGPRSPQALTQEQERDRGELAGFSMSFAAAEVLDSVGFRRRDLHVPGDIDYGTFPQYRQNFLSDPFSDSLLATGSAPSLLPYGLHELAPTRLCPELRPLWTGFTPTEWRFDAKGRMGPPSFTDARFHYAGGELTLTVHIVY